MNSKKIKNVEDKNDLNSKLNLILENQKKILKNERQILGTEKEVLKEEKQIEIEDSKSLKNEKIEITEEEDVLSELVNLEKEFKNSEISSPLTTITKRDMFKGFIGAFIGVISHFAFIYAGKISKEISFLNATILYLVAFVIIVVMLYYTGFRKIEKQIIMKFIPLRASILYIVSILTIIFVNLLFGTLNFPIDFMHLYKLIGASIILAVMGAGTADLIGKK